MSCRRCPGDRFPLHLTSFIFIESSKRAWILRRNEKIGGKRGGITNDDVPKYSAWSDRSWMIELNTAQHSLPGVPSPHACSICALVKSARDLLLSCDVASSGEGRGMGSPSHQAVPSHQKIFRFLCVQKWNVLVHFWHHFEPIRLLWGHVSSVPYMAI